MIRLSTFAEQVVDELDLVGDLGATEDGEEGALAGFSRALREVLELLLDQEAGGLLWEVNADHGAVGAVSGAESVVWDIRVSTVMTPLKTG